MHNNNKMAVYVCVWVAFAVSLTHKSGRMLWSSSRVYFTLQFIFNQVELNM